MPIQSPSGLVGWPTPTPAPLAEQGGALGALRLDRALQAAPAADLGQAHDHDRDEAGQDDEELQHLVVDRAGQAAERDVREHEAGRDDDRHPGRPAEQALDDQGQRVQVDPGDEHRGQGERPGVEQVGRLVVPAAQVVRDAVHPGAVVERHHHQAEEDHRRDRADPVEVHGRDAVLGAVRGHAEDLDRAEVRGDERQPGDPGRQRAAGEQEVLAGGDRPAGHHPDPDHDQRSRSPG